MDCGNYPQSIFAFDIHANEETLHSVSSPVNPIIITFLTMKK